MTLALKTAGASGYSTGICRAKEDDVVNSDLRTCRFHLLTDYLKSLAAMKERPL